MFRTIFSFLIILAVNVAQAADYDVLIRNGNVYDGTGAPAYVADLAIKGDRVAAIGDFSESTVDLEIDANGLAVAPGFFNMMSHAHLSLLKDGRAISDILQGITFEVLSEISLSPVNESTAEFWASIFVEEDVELSWSQLGEYLDIVEASGVAPNFGTFVSAATVRMNVLGMDDVDPTPEQLEVMKAQDWFKMDIAIEKIEALWNEGIPVTADMYTYVAGATGLDASMPTWVQAGGYDKRAVRLKNPQIDPATCSNPECV